MNYIHCSELAFPSPTLPVLFPLLCFAFFCLAWLRSLQPPSRKRTQKRRKRSKQTVSSYWFKKIKLGEPAVPPTGRELTTKLSHLFIYLFIYKWNLVRVFMVSQFLWCHNLILIFLLYNFSFFFFAFLFLKLLILPPPTPPFF